MRRRHATRPAPPGRFGAQAPARPGAGAAYGPAELAAALRETVAPIGAGGPHSAGLVRIRQAAGTRRHRRTVMAGGASVLLAAVATSALVGNGFAAVSGLVDAARSHGGHASSGDGAPPSGGRQPSTRPTPNRPVHPQPRPPSSVHGWSQW